MLEHQYYIFIKTVSRQTDKNWQILIPHNNAEIKKITRLYN